MDLASLDTKKGAEQGYELHLRHPETGVALGPVIKLLGADSGAYQKKSQALQKKRMQQILRNRKMSVSPEEADEEQIELLAVATTGWSDDMVVDGAAFPFNEQNIKALYQRFPWIREQVQEAVNDRGNFLPRSASA